MTWNKNRQHLTVLLLAASVCGGLFAVAVTGVSATARAQWSGIESALARVAPADIVDTAAIRAFYQDRDGKSFWTGSRAAKERARGVIALLGESWTHGFNPDLYHVDQLAALMDEDNSAGRETQFEILMTDAALRYGRDLTGMRVNPMAINQKARYWRQPLESGRILDLIAEGRSPRQALEDLAPKGRMYQMLREELVSLTEAGPDGFADMSFGNRLFYPGSSHKDVATLRAKMGLTHVSDYGPPSFYDDELAAAIMNFQRHHGLEGDGVIGPKTLSLLNRSRDDQMRQVIANLERLRWMEEQKPDRYIMVNIPSQTLWAVEDGQTVLEMPVIVGQPGRQTIAFKTEIEGIRFNPKWTVPLNIKMRDFLPKLQEDPTYLTQKGIEIYQGTGSDRITVDPQSVDWSTVTRQDMNNMRMVQAEGDNNALGRIRVLMPNDYDIYLHDTNAPEYFEKDERTLSSGCVRLSEPEGIARFILARNPGWTEERMQSLIESGNTTEVVAAERLPVYIVYMTMWTDERGRLVYGPDVYKQDEKLLNVMEMASYFHIEKDSDTRLAEATPSQSLSVQ